MLSLVAILVGALAWRVRGAAFGSVIFATIRSGVAVRAVAAVAMSAIPALLYGPWALTLAPALFLGMSLAGWGDDFDIGRNGGRQAEEAARMSCWGLITVAPAAVALLWLGASIWPILLAGIMFGPVYAAAWHFRPHLPAVPRFAAGPTEWAEVVCGGMIAAGIIFAWTS